MRFLKILVVIMGILLVIGFVVLGFAISKKMSTPEKDGDVSQKLSHAAHLIPPGAQIIQMTTGEGTLAVWVKHHGQDQILLISLKNGTLIGSF